MAHNKLFFRIFLILFLLAGSFLYAQEAGYFIDNSSGSPRIIQRIVWDNDEYASGFEAEIQIFRNGSFVDYRIITTRQSYIEDSLPPGRYRLSVTPFDLFGRRRESSSWMEFLIIPAFQPEITGITPDHFFLDQRLERTLFITGNNIFDNSTIYLTNEENQLTPIRVEIIDSSRAKLVFDDETLIPGNYDIYIENPGGLNVSYSEFLVVYRKPMDVFVKILYTPIIPIYGEMRDFFGSSIYFTGLGFSVEAVSSKRSTFNGGFELSGTFYLMDPAYSISPVFNDNSNAFIGAGNGVLFSNIDLNISLQKRFNKRRTMVTFRFGVGVSFMNGYGDSENNDGSARMNLGLSGMFLIHKNFLLEAGVDFSHYFGSINSGLLRPRFGLCWVF
ncbi:MAG: hypothetical protein LBI28_14365 [Treponema sp.]|jgi:hypothetical protein|nr:hypothetical protein [Treponema sp.]